MDEDLGKNYTQTITPPGKFPTINLREILRYRDLLITFVWRDIKVRYKQTAIGVLWAIFQPVLTMLIFTFFFGRVAQVPSDGAPYPVFVYSGLLLWNYFSAALTASSDSMVVNEGIIKKIYFPRLILPMSSVITPAVDFGISFLVLIVLMFFYHIIPSIFSVIAVLGLLVMAIIYTFGLGMFFSAINVKFRDVRYVLPFFMQILLYVTPVIYPVSLVPQNYQWILYLNPMTSIVSLARHFLLSGTMVSQANLLISAVSLIVIFVFGVYYFRATERFFADIL